MVPPERTKKYDSDIIITSGEIKVRLTIEIKKSKNIPAFNYFVLVEIFNFVQTISILLNN